jgi:hypothetical protein
VQNEVDKPLPLFLEIDCSGNPVKEKLEIIEKTGNRSNSIFIINLHSKNPINPDLSGIAAL